MSRFTFKTTVATTLVALSLSTAMSAFAAPTALAMQAEGTPAIEIPQVSGTPAATESSVQPLSIHDCEGPERSREEVLTILGTPPASTGNHKPDLDAPEMRPAASPGTIDQVPVAEIEQTYRSWQACKLLGKTYQQMALETEQFVREDIYGNGRIRTAYSEPTLNEILDAREEVDADRTEMMSLPGNVASTSPRAIDINGHVAISEEGDYVFLDIVKAFTVDGEQILNPDGEMSFRLVDGVWLVDRDGQLP